MCLLAKALTILLSCCLSNHISQRVHSESPMVWKVKPRHTIDAAVIGYTTGVDGIRDVAAWAVWKTVKMYDGRC